MITLFFGDLNEDQEVTYEDLEILKRLNLFSEFNIRGDMNGDDSITLADASLLSRMLALGGVTGEYYLHVYVKDEAGNVRIARSGVFKFDNTSPGVPSIRLSTTGWTNQDITVTINYESGVTRKEYKIGNGNWTTYTTPVTIENNTTVYARGFDGAGNEGDVATSVISNIDKIKPSMARIHIIENGENSKKLIAEGNDSGGSGIYKYEFYINDIFYQDMYESNTNTSANPVIISDIEPGIYVVYAIVYDRAGNKLQSNSDYYTK